MDLVVLKGYSPFEITAIYLLYDDVRGTYDICKYGAY